MNEFLKWGEFASQYPRSDYKTDLLNIDMIMIIMNDNRIARYFSKEIALPVVNLVQSHSLLAC